MKVVGETSVSIGKPVIRCVFGSCTKGVAMEISGYWEKNARVISVSGPIDPSEWMVLNAAFLAAQIAQRHHIVLNLSQLTSSEPWLIAKLFLAYIQLRQQGIRLSLVNPQPFIRKKFEPTNIPALVDYFSTEQEALKAA